MDLTIQTNNLFRGDIIGREIIALPSAASTNDTAFEIARQRQDATGMVVIAEEQTHGRGRLGRTWLSPPGVNLYFTVLLSPPVSTVKGSVITLAAAVAVVTAIRDISDIRAEIKWPNDVMIKGRKAGGILVELRSLSGRPPLAALGIGLNVNMDPEDFPLELRYVATSLSAEKGAAIDRTALLGAVLKHLENFYKILLNGNEGAIIQAWRRLNCTVGEEIAVQIQDTVIRGVAEEINDDGSLCVRLRSGALTTVYAGEVTVLKDLPRLHHD